MRGPDFSVLLRAGYKILYPETQAAEDWVLEQDEPGNLSGGIEADDETLRAISEAGLTIEGGDDE